MISAGASCLFFDPEHAWIPGTVVEWSGKDGTCETNHPDWKKRQVAKLTEPQVFCCDVQLLEPATANVNDLLNLQVLHDGTLLIYLRIRFFEEVFYTNIVAILVALIPLLFMMAI